MILQNLPPDAYNIVPASSDTVIRYSFFPNRGLLSLTSRMVIGTWVSVNLCVSVAVTLKLYLSVVSRSTWFLMVIKPDKNKKSRVDS